MSLELETSNIELKKYASHHSIIGFWYWVIVSWLHEIEGSAVTSYVVFFARNAGD
ncbi:hypothetical protein GCM10028774_46680 [Spirosoma jeollabukense]